MLNSAMNVRNIFSRVIYVLSFGAGLYLLLNFTLDRSAPDITLMTFIGFGVAVVAALLAAWASVAIVTVVFGNLFDDQQNPSRLWLAIALIASTASGAGAFVGALTLMGL